MAETGNAAEGSVVNAATVRIPDRGPAAYVAEFIGTFALVFAICAAVVLFVPGPPDPSPTGAPAQSFFQDFAVVGLVHVLVLFFLIQTMAVMSGAHFNPAVTVAMTAVRQIKPIDSAIYVLMQLAGGTLGALAVKGLYNEIGDQNGQNFGAVGFNADRLDNTLQGMGLEALGTFFLVWAIMGVAVNPSAVKDWSGLVIGGTLGFAVMIIAPMTGAGLNPARALGPAIVAKSFGDEGKWLLLYVLAPVLGALLAVFLYSYLMVTHGKKGTGGAEPVG
ncbi:MAG TPA: aquaporin [Thermoleophilaceae bacterium]|jgi:MIP family channel proteins